MNDDKILVIIVTYNGEFDIPICLSSIYKSTFCLDTIVIDNNSNDNTTKIIKQQFPNVLLYEQHQNLGFGRANNIGLKYALVHNYDFVLLLNQDAEISNDMIEKLYKISLLNRQYYILSPIQYNKKTKSIDPLFRKYMGNLDNANLKEVEFANAAIWFLPISTIKIVGGFDPLFPHYGEDNDYVHRVHYWGGRIGIVQSSKGFHNREYGKPIKEQRLYRLKLCYINLLKNNSNSLFWNFLITIHIVLKKTIKSCLYFNFKEKHLFAFMCAIIQYHKIYKSNHKSKIRTAFLK